MNSVRAQGVSDTLFCNPREVCFSGSEARGSSAQPSMKNGKGTGVLLLGAWPRWGEGSWGARLGDKADSIWRVCCPEQVISPDSAWVSACETGTWLGVLGAHSLDDIGFYFQLI